MARHQEGPMTEDDLSDAADEIQALRAEVREDLAEDLGGDPDDYEADSYRADEDEGKEVVPDGGE